MSSLNKEYYKVIKNNPLLTKKQEIDLANKIKKGDAAARKKMIESNFRLVISIAKKYHRSDVNFDDLIQESSIGLLKAVDRFDPDLGYKFSTYACWWIKQAALQYINENISDIKVPTHSRLLNVKIKKAISSFEEEKGIAPSHEEIADILGETSKKIKYTLKANKKLSSMDKEKSDSSFSLKDTFEDESLYSNPEKLLVSKELEKIVKESLSSLTPKEEKILRLRFGITECPDNIEQFPVSERMKGYLNEK